MDEFHVNPSSGCQDIWVGIKKGGVTVWVTDRGKPWNTFNFFHWFNSRYWQDTACEHVIPLQPFHIFLPLAFITLADSILMKCKLKTWPHPGLLTSTTVIFLHFMLEGRGFFFFTTTLLLLLCLLLIPSASLTLQNTWISVRSAFLPLQESQCDFSLLK